VYKKEVCFLKVSYNASKRNKTLGDFEEDKEEIIEEKKE